MGRPEKLSKEQQAEAVAKVKMHGGRAAVCLEYGISEMTLMRYMKQATNNAIMNNARMTAACLVENGDMWDSNNYRRGEEAAREAANTMKPDEPPMPEAA